MWSIIKLDKTIFQKIYNFKFQKVGQGFTHFFPYPQ